MLKKLPLLILVPVIALLSVACGGTRIYQRDVVYRDREVPTVIYRDVPVYTPAPPPPATAPSVQTTGYYDRWGNWHANGYYDSWGNWHPYPPPR